MRVEACGPYRWPMSQPAPERSLGDVDLSAVGAVLADAGRCRMLLALDDGRALPAGRLAAEAGVSPATASSHLAKLVQAGLLAVEAQGRHRYYRLAGPEVGRLIEALHPFGARTPIRSLRQGTRAAALRNARTCYDHLAGRVAVEIMAVLLAKGYLEGGDGRFDPASGDARVGFGRDVDYALTRSGARFFDEFGVVVPAGRRAVRYCVDWTEQRHHLSGAVGAGLLNRMRGLDWVRPAAAHRALDITATGYHGILDVLGVDVSTGRPDRGGRSAP
jgi:DNA-binding transcriptional ArsR family regulator